MNGAGCEKKKKRKRSSPFPDAGAPPAPVGDRQGKLAIHRVVEFVAEPRPATSAELARVFDRFCTPEQLTLGAAETAQMKFPATATSFPVAAILDAAPSVAGESEARGLKKRRRALKRLTIAELKHLVRNPDVVEVHDATAADPRFLVYLKSCPNSVPVPRHWLQKRGYLHGKRGIDKKPFSLPRFIADTGISKVRDTVQAQDDGKTSKQKQRDRVKPGVGKIEIDYQVLNDAFFKYQTRPLLTGHGDLYYEGKEFCERSTRKCIPGSLSGELKAALGMVPPPAEKGTGAETRIGSGEDTSMQVELPPPWLINMQRYGPPPSYPKLKIPGLTSPIPEAGAFGYHPGGWGKPPVDAVGHAIYGSQVFAQASAIRTLAFSTLHSSTRRWGDNLSSTHGDDDGDGDGNAANAAKGRDKSGFDHTRIVQPIRSGVEVIPSTDATRAEMEGSGVDLRKGFNPGIDTPMSEAPTPLPKGPPTHFTKSDGELFAVLGPKKAPAENAVLWQSTHAYEQHGNAAPQSSSPTTTLSADAGACRPPIIKETSSAGNPDAHLAATNNIVRGVMPGSTGDRMGQENTHDKKYKDFTF